MSINGYRPHVLVLPEDDANRQIANGFCVHHSVSPQIRVEPVAGGWLHVPEEFNKQYAPSMQKFRGRHMVLLIDCDQLPQRIDNIKKGIPSGLEDRVFVIGTLTEPEDLKRSLSLNYEKIGEMMARECCQKIYSIWNHDLLRHNAIEVRRLSKFLGPILF